MSASKISRFLPNNEYLAAVNASAPTAVNPFATIADIPAAVGLQGVMDVGSTYTGAATISINTTDDIDMFAGDAGLVLNSTSGYLILGYGTGTTAGILMGPALGIDGIEVRDETASSGMYYLAPYSAQGIILHGDRWIPDAGWVNSQIALISDLNGIYTADGTISLDRIVTISSTKSLTFHTATDTINEKLVSFTNNGTPNETYFNKSGDLIMEYTGDLGYNSKRIIMGDNCVHAPSGILQFQSTVASGYSRPYIAGRGSTTANPDQLSFELSMESVGQGKLTLYKIGVFKGYLRAETNGMQVSGNLGLGTLPTLTDALITGGGDVKFQGLTDVNLFFADHSLDAIGIGGGASSNYKLAIYDDLSNTQGGLIINSTQVTANINAALISRSGGTGTALTLNASGGSNALSIPTGGIISNSDTTSFTWLSTLSAPVGGRFRLGIAGGNHTSAYAAILRNVGSGQANIGFDAAAVTSGASLNAEYIGLRFSSVSGVATNVYGTQVSLVCQLDGSTTNTFGHYVDWNGNGINGASTLNGTHRAFYADMRSPYASDTITGDVYGIDLYLGAGVVTTIHSGNIIGQRIKSFDAVGSTTTKTVGLEIDLAGSLSTTIYGMTVLGGNSGFGVLAPASMVTVSGDVETVVAGDGLIVLDASNGTRYRIYMDGGVLSSQLA